MNATFIGWTAVLLVSASVSALAQEPAGLPALRDAYQENIEEKSETLRSQFAASLERLEKSLASKSQLEEAIAVRERRVAHTESRDFAAPADTGSGPPEYVRLAETYNRNLESIVRPLRDSYSRALVAMEKKLADEGSLKEALAVKMEREGLGGGDPGARPVGGTRMRLPGAPSNKSELEDYLTYSVWEYRDGGKFKTQPAYLFLHGDGKCFLGPATGEWKATSASEMEVEVPAGSRAEIKIVFGPEAKTFSGTEPRAAAPSITGKLLSGG